MTDDLQLARAVSEVALATRGVQRLGAGRYAEAATYGVGDDVGDKVLGVVVSTGEVRVHIVARYPLAEPIPALAERVHDRVIPSAQGRTTTVVVEDLEVAENEDL